MASEIIRDGVKYRVAHTFEFKNGQISKSYNGGEITGPDIDSIIEHDAANAKLDRQDKYFAMLDAEEEANQLINI
ncbi:MAG: hypothetical protein IJS99_02860 [Synergistaceae bacterium]|nr:hypothetical protein [Synergistaceae bacterium]